MLLRLALAAFLVFGACSASAERAGDVKVVTTVYPIESITRAIAGDGAEVVNVTPPGAEPHDVEPTADQVVDVIEADLVVVVGGFQPAIEQAAEDAEGVVVDALDLVGPPPNQQEGEADAHFWLDPSRLATLAETIASELSEIRPDEASGYRERLGVLVRRLSDLDRSYRRTLAGCESDVIVTSHEAFAYLADRYGLTQMGIGGTDPEAEPSPQRIAEVARLAREEQVTTVFYETLLPPDAAETIAAETGARTAPLDPLESEPEEGDLLEAMEANLEELAEALRCR